MLLASQSSAHTRLSRRGLSTASSRPRPSSICDGLKVPSRQWPALFTLDPFQFPRVPASGIYIVAYFSPEGHIHQRASFKMLILFLSPELNGAEEIENCFLSHR